MGPPDSTNIDSDGVELRAVLANSYILPITVCVYLVANVAFPRIRIPEHALLNTLGFKPGSTLAAALLQVGLVAFFVVWLEARDAVCILKAAVCAQSWADRHECIPIYLRGISILFRGLVFGHGAGFIADSAFRRLTAAWAESGKRLEAEEAAAAKKDQ